MRDFRISVSYSSSIGVQVTVSLLNLQDYLSILADLNNSLDGLHSSPYFQFLKSLFSILWWLYGALLLQFALPSLSYSIDFSVSLQVSGTNISFRFLSVLLSGQPGWQSPLFGRFSYFLVDYLKVCSSGPDQGIRWYFTISETFDHHLCISFSRTDSIYAYNLCSCSQIWISCIILSDCDIIAEGFRFMPLSLVRLRTFRLSTWVSWVQHWGRC